MMTQSILNAPIDADSELKSSSGIDSIRVNYPRDVLQDSVGSRNFNILIVGNTATSKSTLVNTLLTAFSDSKVERAISGRQGSVIDTCIRGFTLPPPINYITLINGVALDSVDLDDFDWDEIINGFYPSKIYETGGGSLKSPYGPIHGIILAVPTIIEDGTLTQQLNRFMDASVKYGISPMVALTKVERYYPEISDMIKACDYRDVSIDLDAVIDVLQKPMLEWSQATGVYEAHMWPIITYSTLRHKSQAADLLARKLIFETIKQGAEVGQGTVMIKDHEPPLRHAYVAIETQDTLQIASPGEGSELAEEQLETQLELKQVEGVELAEEQLEAQIELKQEEAIPEIVDDIEGDEKNIEQEEQEKEELGVEEVGVVAGIVDLQDQIPDNNQTATTEVPEAETAANLTATTEVPEVETPDAVPEAAEIAAAAAAVAPALLESETQDVVETPQEQQVVTDNLQEEYVLEKMGASGETGESLAEAKEGGVGAPAGLMVDTSDSGVAKEEVKQEDTPPPPITPSTTYMLKTESTMDTIPEETTKGGEADAVQPKSTTEAAKQAQEEKSFLEIARQKIAMHKTNSAKLQEARQIRRPGPVDVS